jgi:hypothetical protein
LALSRIYFLFDILNVFAEMFWFHCNSSFLINSLPWIDFYVQIFNRETSLHALSERRDNFAGTITFDTTYVTIKFILRTYSFYCIVYPSSIYGSGVKHQKNQSTDLRLLITRLVSWNISLLYPIYVNILQLFIIWCILKWYP